MAETLQTPADTLRAEICRVEKGGAISRAHYMRLLDFAATNLEDMGESLESSRVEASHHRERAENADQLLRELAAVMDVCGRAARLEVAAGKPIEAAIDCAPFRNIMQTMYGLGPLGEDRPKRVRRTKAATGQTVGAEGKTNG